MSHHPAYKIQLPIFEGPLDLLLYLIKKDELNIYDIPITSITEQYLTYINAMQDLNLDIAGEFLVMAATLMHIKSKMLLPPDPNENPDDIEADPRAELVRRLIEYKTFKDATEKLRIYETKRNAIFTRLGVEFQINESEIPFAEVPVFALIDAFQKVLARFPSEAFHEVTKDEYTVADKVSSIRNYLTARPKVYFSYLFSQAKNKIEVITIFLAILELVRLKEISAGQDGHFDEIEIIKIESPSDDLNKEG